MQLILLQKQTKPLVNSFFRKTNVSTSCIIRFFFFQLSAAVIKLKHEKVKDYEQEYLYLLNIVWFRQW